MITMTPVGVSEIRITGADLVVATPQQWAAQFKASAKRLQKRIAESYGKQRIAGRVNLLRNTPKYDKWKARNNFDTRRGHLYGETQASLDGDVLWNVRGVSGTNIGSSSILFSEQRLRSIVSHAKYYEASKVPGGRILALAASWVQSEETRLRQWERQRRVEAQRVIAAGQSGGYAAAARAAAGARGVTRQQLLRTASRGKLGFEAAKILRTR